MVLIISDGPALLSSLISSTFLLLHKLPPPSLSLSPLSSLAGVSSSPLGLDFGHLLYIRSNMLLGKRPRPSMRRTTSMTGFSGDFVIAADAEADVCAAQPTEQIQQQRSHTRDRQRPSETSSQPRRAPATAVAAAAAGPAGGGDWLEGGYMGYLVSPRGGTSAHRRYSDDFAVVETAPFLRNCGLCKRRLMPGRDTFMYRGDSAFCSLECRQQQMSLDEKKDKCSIRSIRDTATASSGSGSGSDGTIAAA